MQIPVCDIIIPSWNHPELTKDCVKSVLEMTQLPVRLIIVDNGSNPETRRTLQLLKGNDRIELKILYNETNEGFVKASNQGMRISTAPYVCLLNNDTVVWPGWLEEMIHAAQLRSQIGIINPASNNFGDPPERVLPKKIVTEMGTCIGFCLFINRAVIEKIGYLDEGFERAYYEDIDYCLRAKAAGFLCVLAHRAYVYHVGQGSSPKKTPDYIERNHRYFLKKWGPAQRILYPLQIDGACVSSPALNEILNSLVKLTRQGHVFIDLFCRNLPQLTREDLFEHAGLMDHADIHLISVNGNSRYLAYRVLKQILLKRKKPYTQLLYSQSKIGSFLEATRWLHHLPVRDLAP